MEKKKEAESIMNIAKDAMDKLDLSKEEKTEIEESFSKLKSAMSREDFDEINQEFENVKKIQGDLSTKAYKKSTSSSSNENQ